MYETNLVVSMQATFIIVVITFFAHLSHAQSYNLVLDCDINPHHVPILYAKAMGYLPQWCIKEPAYSMNGLQLVANKQHQIAVSYPSDLLRAVHKNMKLKRVGVLLARSPLALAVRIKPGLKTITDLKGRRVGRISPEPSVNLKTFLQSGDLSMTDIETVASKNNYKNFMTGQIDACLILANDEAVTFKNQGLKFNLFTVDQTKMPPYQPFIFVCREACLQDCKTKKPINPKPLMAFLDGINKALKACLAQPDKVWHKVMKAYGHKLKGKKEHFMKTLPYFSASSFFCNQDHDQAYAQFVAEALGWKKVPSHHTWVHKIKG
jgi:ABC-type nitrate/sulfonate/bicarbonate transport system substrate-binding protein